MSGARALFHGKVGLYLERDFMLLEVWFLTVLLDFGNTLSSNEPRRNENRASDLEVLDRALGLVDSLLGVLTQSGLVCRICRIEW